MTDPVPPSRQAVRRTVATSLLGFAGLVAAALIVIVALLYASHRLQN